MKPIALCLLTLSLAATPALRADDSPPRPVVVETVQRAPVAQEVEVRGSVTAPRTARLSTAVAGLVQRVAVDEGERVRAGQPVALLDGTLGRLDLDVAAAATAEAAAALAEAERRLAAARDLGENFFPADEIRSRASAVQTAQSLLARRQAEQARQRELLARHEIRAPFAGVVGARLVQVGEWVAPGTPLVELVDLSSLRIAFALPQSLYGRVGPRTAMQVELDSEPGRRHAARVVAVVPVSDPASRTFTVHAALDQAPPLTPGMSARASVRLPDGGEAVTVSRDAVLRRADGRHTVWVVDAENGNGVAREQPVTLGTAQGARVVVTEGLRGGEQVVVRGNEGLRTGQRVAARR
ncbi:MAG: efflux RND transporter periplasmic adaptor subunit [Ideonella sp.]|nr:efflux RND transporter periplasmic adaptor subunit [Ideonella sp.]